MNVTSLGNAVFWGFWESFKGVYTVFHLDKELDRRRLRRLTHSNSPLRQKQPDSRDQTPIRTLQKHEESTVMSRIIQCGLLNGVIFLLSILLFDYLLLPFVHFCIILFFGKNSQSGEACWFWIELVMQIAFQSVWVVPLFALSKFINNLWFQDIGQSAYKYSRGRSKTSLSLSKSVADFIFSTVIELLFMIQAVVMTYTPVYGLGHLLYWTHLSLLYSLYAFEYKWGEMGWEIHKRLSCIETNWAYFIGFGLPLVFFTQLTNSWVISGCIFSMLFPFFIISANEANPFREACPRINIFSPVVTISNMIFNLIGKNKKIAAVRTQQPPIRR